MAIDQLSTNSTRYSTVPMASGLYLPDNDWTVFIVGATFVSGSPTYIVSTGNFSAANTFNMWVEGSVHDWRANVSGTFVSWGAGAVVDGEPYLAYVTRRNGAIFCGAVSLTSRTANAEGTGVSFSGTVAHTGDLNIGRRADGNSTRYYRGRWSNLIISPNSCTTLNEVKQLADGALGITGTEFFRSKSIHVEGVTATRAKYIDNTGRYEVTTNGTGYGTREEDPLGYKSLKSQRLIGNLKTVFPLWNGDVAGFDNRSTDLPLTGVG